MGLDKFFILIFCMVVDSICCLRIIFFGVGICGMKKVDVWYVIICSFMLFLVDVFIIFFGMLRVILV